ncbi:NTP transferase domain-containing protein [Candidatus Peregrinibacteria bacterium]|nr:NTP transferase domain-containing protein [Candidatus Peregrinibacteria bacterium]
MQPVPDKNFLQFLGKPLVAHQLGTLIRAGFSEILVMGGAHNLADLKKLVKEYDAKGAEITVKEQEDLELGMAGAILSEEKWIGGDPFFAVSANDVVDPSAYDLLSENVKTGEGLLVAKKVSEYFPGGYLKVATGGAISKIVEKPGEGKEPSDLVNIVMHYHPNSKAFLAALKKISSRPNRSEANNYCAKGASFSCDDRYELALQQLFDAGVVYRAVPFSGFWQPIKYPWHVLRLMNYYLDNLKPRLKGKGIEIAKNATIKGNVYLEDGVKVMEGAVISGPVYIGKNTIVGTHSLVRQAHIGADCVIGRSEVARSFMGDGVWLHMNYIGDSVIGNDVSFGAGALTGNFRLDEKNIQVQVNGGDKIDCGSNKFGLVTGDHIRVGINVSFMPGVKIGSNAFVGAGIVVAQDVPEASFVTGSWELKIKPNREKIKPRADH